MSEVPLETQLHLRALALEEKTRAENAASLCMARDPESHCYIDRFGRLPYRLLAEAFRRYAEELQRQADSVVTEYRLVTNPEEVSNEPPVRAVRRQSSKA